MAGKVSIAIIGGGAAGLSAAVYALRAGAEVTVFEQYGLGGLTATIDRVENYPSYKDIEGYKLAENMSEQAKALGVKVKYEQVLNVTISDDEFIIKTLYGEYKYMSVIAATGTKHNKLGIEGDYVGKGVSYCATCDGNFYRNMPVAVVGSGNPAVKEALFLSGLASELYLINPTSGFNADEISIKQLKNAGNVKFLYNTSVIKLAGKDKLESVTVSNGDVYEEIAVSALFVAVGAAPATDYLNGINLDKNNGYIKTDGRMSASADGLFACGDVTDGPLKQIVTACGDGAKAGSFAVAYARKKAAKIQ